MRVIAPRGRDLDDTNAVQVLNAAAWQERRHRLEELGGPPQL
jgi:hypothetical protein